MDPTEAKLLDHTAALLRGVVKNFRYLQKKLDVPLSKMDEASDSIVGNPTHLERNVTFLIVHMGFSSKEIASSTALLNLLSYDYRIVRHHALSLSNDLNENSKENARRIMKNYEMINDESIPVEKMKILFAKMPKQRLKFETRKLALRPRFTN